MIFGIKLFYTGIAIAIVGGVLYAVGEESRRRVEQISKGLMWAGGVVGFIGFLWMIWGTH